MVGLEFMREGTIEGVGDFLFAGEVFVEEEGQGVVEVAVVDFVDGSYVFVEFGQHARSVVFFCEEEGGPHEFLDREQLDVSGAFVFDAGVGYDFLVNGEEEVLSVVVERVGEGVGGVVGRVVVRDVEQLAEGFCFFPVFGVVLERDDEFE